MDLPILALVFHFILVCWPKTNLVYYYVSGFMETSQFLPTSTVCIKTLINHHHRNFQGKTERYILHVVDYDPCFVILTKY